MSIWARIGEFVARISSGAAGGVADLVEAVRTVFEGDPELRRRVAFSVAMIALSAKMAKADGIVTQDEIRAFQDIFAMPQEERRNVERLYRLAMADTAGYEIYAERLAGLCGSGQPDCRMLEDILDGLFHIAKADGLIHEKELRFLARIAEIFAIGERRFEAILARHVIGEKDPWAVLGVARDTSFEEVRRHYLRLVSDNHPDRMMARGVPEEFLALANDRMAALNAAYETIERGRVAA
ncbi:DnaJ family molecular chaperone [Aquibium sp. ELW1220]|uniref:J domain-containing protein n=1 Tax=Aquibium sp. ELW1220 TaxID=2976766 RepID=UPI0025AF2024|nr:DnaJ family molecular chaperone [Aquibium sp. ELW1220]MDN2580578.1 DnaJ family molecular chaperone [Aquibium sp. ELW1220]